MGLIEQGHKREAQYQIPASATMKSGQPQNLALNLDLPHFTGAPMSLLVSKNRQPLASVRGRAGEQS